MMSISCLDCVYCEPATHFFYKRELNNYYAICKHPKSLSRCRTNTPIVHLGEKEKYTTLYCHCSTMREFNCGKRAKFFRPKNYGGVYYRTEDEKRIPWIVLGLILFGLVCIVLI